MSKITPPPPGPKGSSAGPSGAKGNDGSFSGGDFGDILAGKERELAQTLPRPVLSPQPSSRPRFPVTQKSPASPQRETSGGGESKPESGGPASSSPSSEPARVREVPARSGGGGDRSGAGDGGTPNREGESAPPRAERAPVSSPGLQAAQGAASARAQPSGERGAKLPGESGTSRESRSEGTEKGAEPRAEGRPGARELAMGTRAVRERGGARSGGEGAGADPRSSTRPLDESVPEPVAGAAYGGVAPGAGAPGAVDAPAAPESPRIDPALLQALVDRLVSSVEVHLDRGRPRVDLALDLGPAGKGRAEVNRTPEGEVKVVFRLEDVRGQKLVAERLPELVQGLERRGIKTDTVQIQGPDGTVWKAEREGHEEVSPQHRGGEDAQGEGRSRSEYVEEESAEEEPPLHREVGSEGIGTSE